MSDHIDPILEGLFHRLPPVGQQWALHKRAAWLRAMASAFELIYQPDVTETVIGIRLAHQSPQGISAGLADLPTTPVENVTKPKESL